MDAGTRGERTRQQRAVVCPECLSVDVRKARYREYRARFFLVLRPYRCLACGLLFRAPCNVGLCAASAALAVGLVVLTVTQELAPAVRAFASNSWSAKVLLHLAIGAIAGVGFAWMALESIRTIQYSRQYWHRIRRSPDRYHLAKDDSIAQSEGDDPKCR